MLRFIGFFTVATLLAGPTLARADSSFSLGVEGGVMQFESSASFNQAGFAWGLRGGFGLFGPTRLEARLLSASQEEAGTRTSLREGSAQLRLSIIPGAKTTPYAFGGFGIRIGEQEVAGPAASDTSFIVPFGAGMDLAFADHFVLAPEFTWHHRIGDAMAETPDALTSHTWNLSLIFRVEI
jgi:opacity protein-like surface antigen